MAGSHSLLLVVLCSTACGNHATDSSRPRTAETHLVDGFFVPPGAPPPQACATADDCIGDTIPGENGCCQNYSFVPHSRRYREWMYAWRTEHCAGIECPSPPVPTQPAECYFQMECNEGRCQNQCDESMTDAQRLELIRSLAGVYAGPGDGQIRLVIPGEGGFAYVANEGASPVTGGILAVGRNRIELEVFSGGGIPYRTLFVRELEGRRILVPSEAAAAFQSSPQANLGFAEVQE